MSMIQSPAIGTRMFALRDTTLAPSMLVRSAPERELPWVLADPRASYHYLGRNASFALIRGLGLEGAEMLFPSFFGPPVLQAPVEAGARIRFYPVRTGMRVTVEDIEAALTPNTRAIYLIHYNGFPAPIADVLALARDRGIVVIEDAAHALLTRIGAAPAGSLGDGAIWSFYKWAPVPNGAAAIANTQTVEPISGGTRASVTSGLSLSTFSLLDHAALRWGEPGERARSAVRWAGKRLSRAAKLTYVPTGGVEFEPMALDVAMSSISHRVLRAQDWTAIAQRRRRNFTLLADLLADCAPPVQGELPAGVVPLFYPTAIEGKRALLPRLAARGVEGRNFWELHHPMAPQGMFPDTDELRRTMLELPIHQDLSTGDIRRIAGAVRAELGWMR
jgi:dTDP-4-amino-4,6-dideoxygalactose transaminase